MENLTPPPMVTASAPLVAVGDLVVPFDPVTIRRPLPTQTFASMLGLVPGITAAPDSEFIARLLTGRRSTDALVRRQVGGLYKNLENMLRGRHRVSDTTKTLLADALGIGCEVLERFVHGREDGPVMPQLADLFLLAENVPTRQMAFLLDVEVLCQCCGENMLDDQDTFWSRSDLALGQDEYRFVERLLNALFGAYRFLGWLRGTQIPSLQDLAATPGYPIGNWLEELAGDRGAANLGEFATQLQLISDLPDFSHARLRKWSCGADQIPPEKLEVLLAASSDPTLFHLRFIAARTIALLREFLSAASRLSDAPSSPDAQRVLHKRLGRIAERFDIARHVERKRQASLERAG